MHWCKWGWSSKANASNPYKGRGAECVARILVWSLGLRLGSLITSRRRNQLWLIPGVRPEIIHQERKQTCTQHLESIWFSAWEVKLEISGWKLSLSNYGSIKRKKGKKTPKPLNSEPRIWGQDNLKLPPRKEWVCCEDIAHKETRFQESRQQIQRWVDLNPRKEREKKWLRRS